MEGEWHKQFCYCIKCNHEWVGMVFDELMKDNTLLECPFCKERGGQVKPKTIQANQAETLVIPNSRNKYQILKRLNKKMDFISDPVYYTDLTECEKHINKMPIEFEVMIYVERLQITGE